MYKVIIELKNDISNEMLKTLEIIIESAFDNRGGKILRSESISPYYFEFIGDDDKYGCMDLSAKILGEQKIFLENVESWKWEEQDVLEWCNLLKVFSARFNKKVGNLNIAKCLFFSGVKSCKNNYRVIIKLKKDISDETLKEITTAINNAFDNRGGKVVGAKTNSPYCFEFSGGEDVFCCMELGLIVISSTS